MSVRQGNEGGDCATQRVAGHPDFGIGVNCSHIVVEVLGSVVVAVLLAQGSDEAGGIASVGRGLAVADLSPEKLASLAAAAAEEEVVVDLVVCGRVGAVEHGWRCTL